ncbi:hypothetical protein ACEWY4_007310 [Coilia grayii]|uniref:Transposase domain-containing protein n=1 Tax=Coilia grayii TaxID=363190 RepID=A0ABD1KCJ8_9TELE
MAKLSNGVTYLEAAGTDLSPPSVLICNETESDEEVEGEDWFMASSSDNMSATSGEEDFDDMVCSCSSDEENNDTAVGPIDNLQNDLRAWAVTTNTPISHLSSLLSVLRKHFPHSHLPKDGRTLLSTPTGTEVQLKAGGQMHYFGVANGVLERLRDNATLKTPSLHLQINADGLPLFKSSSLQFWPILGLIEEDSTKTPFVIALYCGHSKPSDANEYLSDFVAEMGKLASDGLEYQSYLYRIEISCFVCDAPARTFLKNIKAHNSYSGCERCVDEGIWLNQRLNYPNTDSALRTDESFRDQTDPDHHKEGESALLQINVGMVSQFVLDFMHLVCLGVVRKLIWLWMKGPLTTRTGNQAIMDISATLIKLGKSLPKEFCRKGRSLREVDRWKATEFRTFLLYTGPVALRKALPKHMYEHFLLLHVSISILCSPRLHKHYCDYADNLLKVFVQNFSVIYGDFVVYNIHNLIHLASDVRKFGPLPQISAFPFENFLYKLKKQIRKPNQSLQQSVRRLAEQSGVSRVCRVSSSPLPSSPTVSMSHYTCDKFTLSLTEGNNMVSSGNATFKIEAINRTLGGTSFVVRQYLQQQPFFTYPVNSLELGTAVVDGMSRETRIITERDIDCKMVSMQFNKRLVTYPLNHI